MNEEDTPGEAPELPDAEISMPEDSADSAVDSSDTPDDDDTFGEGLAAASAQERPRRRSQRGRGLGSSVIPPDPRGWRALAIVAAVLVVLAVAGTALMPAADQATVMPSVEPVDSSTAVCPEPGSVDLSRTTSTMMVLPDMPGQDRPGSAEITFLGGTDDPLLVDESGEEAPKPELNAPGDAATVVAESRRLPPLEVRTQGSLAPGLVVTQTTLDSYNEGRGLASQACLGPATSWWFVGGGSIAGRDSELVLVNPEATQAELEVQISGPEGEVSTPRLRGIVVEPRSRTVVRLNREAPRLPYVAWHVQVRAGRIVAALSDKETDGFFPRGADWIPASAEPSTRVFVPGIIPGDGGRQLLLHAPGDLNAQVQVRLVTSGGSYVPSALSEVSVPAGTVVQVDLDAAAEGQAVTVDLISDEPVVAGVRQRHPGIDASKDPLEETSFATGAVPITSAAAVTGLPAQRATAVTVWITAPGEVRTISDSPLPLPSDDPDPTPTTDVEPAAPVTVTLRVLPVDEAGLVLPSPEDIVVTVPRDRLVAVNIPRPADAAWYAVQATPEGGEVVIAHEALRRNANGSLITGYPWRPLIIEVDVPRAVVEPQLGLPASP